MMKVLKFLTILVVLIEAVQCLSFPEDSEPLYLTKYIESNDTATARRLSRVYFPDLLSKDVVSYSGFLTVNKEYNSNMFFWYFPARKNSSTAPLIQWLQGGPGGASLYGMLMENGPVYVNPKTLKLEKRQYNWNEEFNVLYIDNPVGCGFSFTDNEAGYLTNQVDVGKYLLEALVQFYEIFPELRPNRFYLTGESYAGKYIPAYAYTIYKNRNNPDPKRRINLKGLAIGNGVTDPINQLVFGDLSHYLGLIDDNYRQIFNTYQNAAIAYIEAGNFLGAVQATFSLINTPNCLFNNITGFTSPFNFLKQHGYDEAIDAVNEFMSTSGIPKYLHVGERPFVPFSTPNVVLSYLINDIMQSVAPWVAELIDSTLYTIFIYNGQLDVLAGPMAAQQYLAALEFDGAEEYKKAVPQIWRVGNEVAGYIRKARTLTQISVSTNSQSFLINLISSFIGTPCGTYGACGSTSICL